MTTKTTTAKAVNYTAEQTAAMVQQYTAAPTAETVASMAEAMGKSVRSIVAKLTREGVYKKKEYTTKKGEAPVTKEELASKLTELCGLSEAEADSMAKANKTGLQKIIAKLEG
jgi:flagellar biosynthesis/type III secretory pathway ATPase